MSHQDEQTAQQIVYADINIAKGQASERLISRVAAALTAARAEEREQLPQWQAIESAPKDGTYILLLGDSGYTTTPHRIAVGCWIAGYRDFWLTHSNDAFTDDGEPPTHWMPLPPPPEKE